MTASYPYLSTSLSSRVTSAGAPSNKTTRLAFGRMRRRSTASLLNSFNRSSRSLSDAFGHSEDKFFSASIVSKYVGLLFAMNSSICSHLMLEEQRRPVTLGSTSCQDRTHASSRSRFKAKMSSLLPDVASGKVPFGLSNHRPSPVGHGSPVSGFRPPNGAAPSGIMDTSTEMPYLASTAWGSPDPATPEPSGDSGPFAPVTSKRWLSGICLRFFRNKKKPTTTRTTTPISAERLI